MLQKNDFGQKKVTFNEPQTWIQKGFQQKVKQTKKNKIGN